MQKSDPGLIMAALLLTMLPILILYLLLQKFIAEGVTSGLQRSYKRRS